MKTRALFFAAAMVWGGTGPACAENACWEKGEDDAAETLAAILGSNPAGWTFSDKGQIEEIDGRKTLATGDKLLTLLSSTVYGTNIEYTLTFRVTAPPEKAAGLAFQIGITNAASVHDASPGAAFHVPVNAPYASSYVYGPTNSNAALLFSASALRRSMRCPSNSTADIPDRFTLSPSPLIPASFPISRTSTRSKWS
ncbi:MAG: hypothetical protein HY360_24345 [Verrucomicrobia bacterium]|nr:hypothetical protein [Verrucomicrobiota bacterium]